MQLKSLQNFFQNGLIGYYPKEEINAFFYRICKQHLEYKRIDVSLQSNALITPETFEYFETILSRLLTYEPIQYILGTTSFFGLDFKVDPNVLIPRPETEELVAWAVEFGPYKTIADICTGSGCIALGLKSKFSESNVTGLDISTDALSLAKENSKLTNLDVEFIHADVLNINRDLLDQKPIVYFRIGVVG